MWAIEASSFGVQLWNTTVECGFSVKCVHMRVLWLQTLAKYSELNGPTRAMNNCVIGGVGLVTF